MFTTTRVSVGIALGPGSMSGLGEAVAEAEGDDAGGGVALTRCALWLLLGSITQPETQNIDKTRISTGRFISFDSFVIERSNARCSFLSGIFSYACTISGQSSAAVGTG